MFHILAKLGENCKKKKVKKKKMPAYLPLFFRPKNRKQTIIFLGLIKSQNLYTWAYPQAISPGTELVSGKWCVNSNKVILDIWQYPILQLCPTFGML